MNRRQISHCRYGGGRFPKGATDDVDAAVPNEVKTVKVASGAKDLRLHEHTVDPEDPESFRPYHVSQKTIQAVLRTSDMKPGPSDSCSLYQTLWC